MVTRGLNTVIPRGLWRGIHPDGSPTGAFGDDALKFLFSVLLIIFCVLSSPLASADTAASAYNPPWAGSLSWAAHNELFSTPPFGSYAYLENNSIDSNSLPWWATDVAHPITDYDAAKLPTGGMRVDTALIADMTFHRLLPGWSKQTSPSGIDNVYTFTPGSKSQEDQSSRPGENAFLDLGIHPTEAISADIGAEAVGNYDQRYWVPVSDEHRMFNDRQVKIVRGEIK